MRKNITVLIFLLIFVLFFFVNPAMSVEKTDPQLNITNIKNGDAFKPGETVTVNVSMTPTAARLGKKLKVLIFKNNQILASKEIMEPKTNNQIELQLPMDLSTGAGIVQAIIYPQEIFTLFSTYKNIQIKKVDPKITITNIQTNDTFSPGQIINVNVSISSEAVGLAKGLKITLGKDTQVFASKDISSPQTDSNASLQIPSNFPAGSAVIHATLSPPSVFSGYYGTYKVIKINKLDPQLNITNIPDGTTFYKGQNVDVSVSVNPAAAAAMNKLIVSVNKDGQTLISKDIVNPQAINQVAFKMPTNITTGQAAINVNILPESAFTASNTYKSINIICLDPQLNFTNIQNDYVFQAGQNITVDVSINPAAVELADKLKIVIGKESQILISKEIDNPQSTNQISLQIPGNVAAGSYTIHAIISPPPNFMPYGIYKIIKIK